MASTAASDTQAAPRPSLPELELGDLSLTQPSASPIVDQSSSSPRSASGTAHTTAATQASVEEEEARDSVPTATSPTLTRQVTSAIGPPTDLPTPMLEAGPSALAAGPVIQFTLLLASTGTRHSFQLNEKYLTKRNVKAQGQEGTFDPGVISVYSLKELILKDWREDWDAKPSSPSAIRLIFFGHLLADNASLRDCKLLTDGTANVLHITVKPQDVMDDEEAGKGGKASLRRGRDDGSSGGCRCVIL